MAKKRGSPFKNRPIVTVRSYISDTVIADTIECGNTQQVLTPIGAQFLTRSLEVGTTSGNTGATQKLVLSPNPSINQESPIKSEEKLIALEKWPNLAQTEENQQRPTVLVPVKENLRDAPWSKLFTGNRFAKNGIPLTYIAPDVVDWQYVDGKMDESSSRLYN